MIFQHTHELVLEGKKSQTRRLCKPNERLLTTSNNKWVDIALDNGDRVKWAVGKTYAVQPGRGKKAVGRIRLTGIRQEHVQDITEADAVAEGMKTQYLEAVAHYAWWVDIDPIEDFARTWGNIHTKPGTRWADSPLVWVLEFKLVEEA